jgi:hypothetical protein
VSPLSQSPLASFPARCYSVAQIFGDSSELLKGGLQVLDHAGGKDIGRWQGISALQALVAEPEEVEAQLVAFEERHS